MKHTNYCSRCKATDVPLLKYSRGRDGVTQYHQCRDCQSKKQRRYRTTTYGAEAVRAAQKTQYRINRRKIIARQLLNQAVKKGSVFKPNACSGCGSSKNIQGHHPDYSEPLKIVWLCSSCHADKHRV